MKKIIFLLLISVSVKAQKYVAEAPLTKIEKDGFYEIPLPPGLSSLAEYDLRNVRILDENGQEVPMIIEIAKPSMSSSEYVEYKMEKEIRKGCCTILTFSNERIPINNVTLRVRNNEVVKWATLSGSDDKKTWYALKDRFVMGYDAVSSTSYMHLLDFPLSDYAYYRVTIDDSKTAPLDIKEAGYYKEQTDVGEYYEVIDVKMAVADSVKQHRTWVKLFFDSAQCVDKIAFEISSPLFYNREATIHEKNRYSDPLPNITSGKVTIINYSTKAKELLVSVENKDNPPLKFMSVRVWQLKRSMRAWLEENHSYRMAFGNSEFNLPNYDIGYFKDSIPNNAPEIEAGEVKVYDKPKEASGTPTFFTNSNIIWFAIAGVIAILGVMSVRMLRDKNLTNNQ